MSVDIFGDIVDADTIEQAVLTTLKDWLPAHLRHQERRKALAAGTLPDPKSWPVTSEFDMDANALLPAIIVESPGTGPVRHDRGVYSVTWRFEIAVVLGDRHEREARKLAALYIAAVRGALAQNRTLGGTVEACRWVGPDDHAYGITEKRAQRAIYGTAFEVDVRDVVNARLGPTDPPADPADPPNPDPSPTDADITVTATDLEEPLP
jgi:hypothetical protein